MKINKEMLISEIIQKIPESQEMFLMAGLHCIGCFGAKIETLEQGMKAHGYSDEEIDDMINELNSIE